jgi:archaellum biogenesis ATPase FlaH
MAFDLLREIVKNKFLLFLMEEKEYVRKLEEIIKSVGKTKTKICYVCMSKPYADVSKELEDRGIDISNFFFIDVLTSYYKEPEPAGNCVFVRNPNDFAAIRAAISRTISEKQCNVILFDTISTMLIYQETSSIVKFTHHLLSERGQENVKKLFIVLKHDTVPMEENQKLVKDLGMFADKTLDLG